MKYWIITYGCQMNEADSERIAASFEKKGYKPAKEINKADLIMVNMCSVRQSAVDRVWGKIKELKKIKNKNPRLKLALTGCVLKSDLKKLKEHFDIFFKNKGYLKTPPSCKNGSRALVPISFGCNNYCTYCAVPYTRGNLVCRSHKEIVKETKAAAKNGVKEIWLLGQNVNDYQSPADKKINFPELLKMTSAIPGKFLVYFMSPNPKDFSNKLIEAMTDKKIARFLNLPLQSGDNEILRKMNRPYTSLQYKNLVKEIRKKIPDINLSTDIIVGFPGEAKKQFENTKKLIKDIKFDLTYISKYSSRPGTAASKLKDSVPIREKKRRWKILNKIVNEKDIK